MIIQKCVFGHTTAIVHPCNKRVQKKCSKYFITVEKIEEKEIGCSKHRNTKSRNETVNWYEINKQKKASIVQYS